MTPKDSQGRRGRVDKLRRSPDREREVAELLLTAWGLAGNEGRDGGGVAGAAMVKHAQDRVLEARWWRVDHGLDVGARPRAREDRGRARSLCVAWASKLHERGRGVCRKGFGWVASHGWGTTHGHGAFVGSSGVMCTERDEGCVVTKLICSDTNC